MGKREISEGKYFALTLCSLNLTYIAAEIAGAEKISDSEGK